MTRRPHRDDPEEWAYRQRTGTDDLPLFQASVPYQRGSATSKEAADAMRDEVPRLRRLVLDAFVDAGPAGLTADQAAEVIGESVLAVRPRCTELRQSGHLEPTGERRANQSGLNAAVLRVR